MKAKTLKTFKDKQAGKVRRAGDVFECTPARFSEITAKLDGYVEKVDKPATPKTRHKK